MTPYPWFSVAVGDHDPLPMLLVRPLQALLRTFTLSPNSGTIKEGGNGKHKISSAPPNPETLPGYRAARSHSQCTGRTVLEGCLELWRPPRSYSIHVWSVRAVEHVSGGPRALRGLLIPN